jgi:soluble lytic murein transglycosylase-like protein
VEKIVNNSTKTLLLSLIVFISFFSVMSLVLSIQSDSNNVVADELSATTNFELGNKTVTKDVLQEEDYLLNEKHRRVVLASRSSNDNQTAEQAVIENTDKLSDMPNYDIPLKESTQLYIWEYSQKKNISYELVLSIIFKESSFKRDAINKSCGCAFGLMQLHEPSNTLHWLAGIAEKELELRKGSFNWRNPQHNVTAGVWYLSYLRNEWIKKGYSEEDSSDLSILSFNMGLGNAKKYIRKHDASEWKYVKSVYEFKTRLETGELSK